MSAQSVIAVRIPNNPYDVVIAPGLLPSAGAAVRKISDAKTACIITDDGVAPHYLDKLTHSLEQTGEFRVVSAVMPRGEPNKRIETLLPVYDKFLAAGIDRDTPIVSLGGGIVGDMAGVVAGTILRGVPLVQVPTTLLAMVDASIGGKAAVNHPVGKNLIGVFQQPVLVLADPTTLKTLGDDELRGGLAECIKHDAIRDANGFAELERHIDLALKRDENYLAQLVAHNVQIKAAVVAADPLERGERAHLNFGHTFAHAIELVSEHRYSHGQAVALGMVAAAQLSANIGLLKPDDARRIAALIKKVGLPTGQLKCDAAAILTAMQYDKKVRHGKVRLILLDAIGHALISDDVPSQAITRAVETLRNS